MKFFVEYLYGKSESFDLLFGQRLKLKQAYITVSALLQVLIPLSKSIFLVASINVLFILSTVPFCSVNQNHEK